MERFLPSLRQSLQHAASISICLAPSSFHYHSIPTYPESPSRLDFELASFLPAQRSHIALDWLSEHLHGSGITTPPIDLHFEFGFDFTRDDRILTYFSRLESVTSLKVADRVVGPCRLLEWLSEQPTPSCTWGFPNLINLEIGPSNLLLWDIMKMGRKRYGTEEGPTKLKSFVVVGNEWPDVELMPEAIHRAFPGVECSHERASWKHMVCKINVDTEGDSRNDEEQDDAVSETSWQVDSETTDETGNSSVEESTSSNEMDTDDG
ncbi:hypothetical protein FRB90_003539 [Tulasnella sp. 427]|nr:hypothetical protein FRB90_003539 [Tulasnella sp. 427]